MILSPIVYVAISGRSLPCGASISTACSSLADGLLSAQETYVKLGDDGDLSTVLVLVGPGTYTASLIDPILIYFPLMLQGAGINQTIVEIHALAPPPLHFNATAVSIDGFTFQAIIISSQLLSVGAIVWTASCLDSSRPACLLRVTNCAFFNTSMVMNLTETIASGTPLATILVDRCQFGGSLGSVAIAAITSPCYTAACFFRPRSELEMQMGLCRYVLLLRKTLQVSHLIHTNR